MAERRMFSRSIVLSDSFLDLPASARCLYFIMSMSADDDGFVASPKAIIRQCGASRDDLFILMQKNFVIGFESGIVAIKHWRMNNYIQKDRYKATTYKTEKARVQIDENGAYTLELNEKKSIAEDTDTAVPDTLDTNCIQSVSKMDTQVRLGKVRIDKVSLDEECVQEPEGTNAETAFCAMPLKNNKKYFIYEATVKAYEEAYPNVDVRQNLKKMIMWCNANAGRRKTESGIERFINSWLAREADKLVLSGSQSSNEASYDLDEFIRHSLSEPLIYPKGGDSS